MFATDDPGPRADGVATEFWCCLVLDLGWTELFVIAVVAILVIGPRDLPKTLRSVGQFTNQLRRMAGEFRKQFDDAVREADLDEVRKTIDGVRSADPRNQVKKAVSEFTSVGKDLKDAVEKPLSADKTASTATGTQAEAPGRQNRRDGDSRGHAQHGQGR